MNKLYRMILLCLIPLIFLVSCRVFSVNKPTLQENPYSVTENTPGEIENENSALATKESGIVEIEGRCIFLDAHKFGIDNTYSNYPRLSGAANLNENLLVVGTTGTSEFPAVTLTLYDLKNKTIINSLPVADEGDIYLGLRITEDQIIVKYLDGFCLTDHMLSSFSVKHELPAEIYADHDLRGSIWYFNYDVSKDFKTVVYAKSDGVYSYDLETKKSKLLVERLPPGPTKVDLTKDKYLPAFAPYFISNDTWIVAQISNLGMAFVPLDKSQDYLITRSVHPFIWNWPIIGKFLPQMSSMNIMGAGDWAMSLVNTTNREVSKPIPIRYSNEQEPKLSAEANMLFTDRYYAYIRQIEDTISDLADAHYTINVVDLSNMTTKTVLTLKAGIPSLLGITDDGRVLLTYKINNEKGLLITE